MTIFSKISNKLSKLIKIAIDLPGMGGEGSKLPKPISYFIRTVY
jgi:hypothetical protein